MREIVVISGKGGTGKTSLAASFAVLGGKDVVVADCDVDAADMHLLLEPDFAHGEDFLSGQTAVVDPDRCIDCGACAAVCRFDAVGAIDGRTTIDAIACEGCGYCARVCPEGAITNVERNVGQWYRSKIRTGSTMVHARLRIGADNSGKLVARVKNEARAQAERNGKHLVLVDGSPGIGCPVISSLSGASLAVLVTEPTVSALHDLRRVHDLAERFGIPCGCVINKADLNPLVHTDLRRFLEERGIALLAEIPYDDQFTAAITHGRTVVEWDASLEALVRPCWAKIIRLVAGDGNAGPASPAIGGMP